MCNPHHNLDLKLPITFKHSLPRFVLNSGSHKSPLLMPHNHGSAFYRLAFSRNFTYILIYVVLCIWLLSLSIACFFGGGGRGGFSMLCICSLFPHIIDYVWLHEHTTLWVYSNQWVPLFKWVNYMSYVSIKLF